MQCVGARLTNCILAIGLAFSALLLPGLRSAAAIEVKCVEASRYKYLFQIFGNDRQRFANYLQINP